MQIVKNTTILYEPLFLPAGLLDYFDITEASNMGDYFMLVLVEKDIVAQ